jgi:hypothetical protein
MHFLENDWTDFYEVWYGRYAIGDYSKLIILNFVRSVIPTWRMLKIARWKHDDANRLRMCSDIITQLQHCSQITLLQQWDWIQLLTLSPLLHLLFHWQPWWRHHLWCS